MNKEKIVIIQFKLTRNKLLILLTGFLVAIYPKILGSETFTLTTYYPAPYGGYVRLLTTNNTYLATTGGNVGIGTTLPVQKLQVEGSVIIRDKVGIGTTSPDASARVTIEGRAISPTLAAIYWRPNDIAPTPPVGFLGFASAADAGTTGNSVYIGATITSNANVVFRTGGINRMIVTNTGNVGIGKASPGAKLEIAGQIKITGGSPGSGKVLISDASGLASWKTSVFTLANCGWVASSYCGARVSHGWIDASCPSGKVMAGVGIIGCTGYGSSGVYCDDESRCQKPRAYCCNLYYN